VRLATLGFHHSSTTGKVRRYLL